MGEACCGEGEVPPNAYGRASCRGLEGMGGGDVLATDVLRPSVGEGEGAREVWREAGREEGREEGRDAGREDGLSFLRT